MVFPTLAHLTLIEEAGSAAAALATARTRTVSVVTPHMRTTEDGTIIGAIPDGSGYPISEWVNWVQPAHSAAEREGRRQRGKLGGAGQ